MSLAERVREVEGFSAANVTGANAPTLGVEELRRDIRRWTSL